MTQNSLRLSWGREELDARLKEIMRKIHDQCVAFGTREGHVDYVNGANIAGFVNIAGAVLADSIVWPEGRHSIKTLNPRIESDMGDGLSGLTNRPHRSMRHP